MTTPNQAHIYAAINPSFQVKTDRIIAESSFIYKLRKGHQGCCSSFSAEMFPSPTLISCLGEKNLIDDCRNNLQS